MTSPKIPDQKAPAPMPVQDDQAAREARTRELAAQALKTGRQSTILSGVGGDTKTPATRSSDMGTKETLG